VRNSGGRKRDRARRNSGKGATARRREYEPASQWRCSRWPIGSSSHKSETSIHARSNSLPLVWLAWQWLFAGIHVSFRCWVTFSPARSRNNVTDGSFAVLLCDFASQVVLPYRASLAKKEVSTFSYVLLVVIVMECFIHNMLANEMTLTMEQEE